MGCVQDVIDNLPQPFGILSDHVGEPKLSRVVQILFQQGVGLADGRQRVAYFVCYGSRHAAHAGQLFRAHASFECPKVLQKEYA